MKKLFVCFALAAAILSVGCKKYDDSDLQNRVGNLEQRVTTLEELCKQMNTNISSLQTLINALQENDYITSVTPLYEGDMVIGYTIHFTKSEPITIYHGKDGQNGKDGTNGKDGYTPQIGVKQDTDGHYYWTLDGDWLLGNDREKILAEGTPGRDGVDGKDGKDGADGKDGQNGKDGQDGANGKDGQDGKDGITPKFKIEDGDWYVSTDNGESWDYLGRATGADGKDGQNGADGTNGKDGQNGVDGDSMFSGVDTSNPNYVIFTLSDGTQIKIPTWQAFEELKKLCEEMNTNIQSLQTLVTALQEKDYITGITPVEGDGGAVIGYTITFTRSAPITIYHGKDGKDGTNGKDGQNGKDGKDGLDGDTPQIGVKQDTDGHYYWTLDGDWLTGDDGQKILAEGTPGRDGADGKDGTNGKDGENGKDGQNGKDGITPQFKIEEGDWSVSTDNGQTWQNVGRATGENGKDGQDGTNGKDGKDGKDGQDGTNGKDGVDGKDGDSFFQKVDTTSDPDFVIFTLADGTEIKIPTWYAFEELKKLCQQMNTNIASLQKMVDAMEAGDYLVSCTPLMDNDKQIGYTLTFSKSDPVVIYHGKDGKDGTNGKDGENGKDGTNGKDGVNGADGHTPQMGVKEENGVLYWTVDGNWLTDDAEQKIPVTGKDGQNGTPGKDGANGITPQLEIRDGYWWISYNNGDSWQQLGKATGDNGKDGQNGTDGTNGKDGDSLFQKVDTTSDPDYVIFTLADGTEFKLPRYSALAIAFDEEGLVAMRPNSTRTIGYTVTGNTENLKIEVLSSGDVKAKCDSPESPTGTITLTTGATIDEYSRVVVLASNGEKTIMSSITFEEAALRVTGGSVYEVEAEGENIEVAVYTNAAYRVSIPDEAQEWIRCVSTRAWRSETVTLQIAANDSDARNATIDFVDEAGVPYESVLIRQDVSTAYMFPDPNFRQYVLGNFDTDQNGKISREEALAVKSIFAGSKNIASLEGVQYFTNLTYLSCYSNQLTELDVSHNTALTTLYCYSNQLTTLDVSHNTALTTLSCYSNQLTTLDVSQNTALTELNCRSNKLAALVVSGCTALTSLNCYSNELTTLDVSGCTALTSLDCYSNELTTLDVSGCTALTSLDCQMNQLPDLDVSGCTALTSLTCSNNQLTKLDVSHNTALETLYCYRNQLTDLDVSHNTALTFLMFESNQLTTLDVSKNTALTTLRCASNLLTKLDLSENKSLTMLECFSNPLKTLDVSLNTALETLICHSNELTKLDVSLNMALTYLNCSWNQLTKLDLSQNTELGFLSCNSNQLTELDVSKTNLGRSTSANLLSCAMPTLKTLYLKKGWSIKGVTDDNGRSTTYINRNTEIKFVE